ncbi:hypothetical protein BGZ74_002557, partial [Mortierella antarctica]
MTDSLLTLFCLVDGDKTSFEIDIDPTKTVARLKDLIKEKKSNDLSDVDADQLTLWKVSIPVAPKNERKEISLADVPSKEELDETDDVSDVFKESPPKKTIHVIVQRPLQVHAPLPARVSTPLSGYLSDQSRPGTPLSGDLRVDIKKITDKFFAPGTPISDFLDAYVRGEQMLPVTTSGVRGLPKVARRGAIKTLESRPNLLFLDLPVPPSSVEAPPERFRSNVLLGVLEKMQSQDLPVFGVSGCGKTRSVIELLCLQWGFYFNAAKKDLGSNDLSQLAESLDIKTMEEQGPRQNTAFARNMTLVLFLSRLLVLKYCLQVPDCRQTFSSASWAVLQVCPHMFKDVFSELFSILYDRLEGLAIFESALRPIVRDEFLSVRESLAAHGYPNFSTETKLRLVVDEAQILSDKGSTIFQSSFLEADPRPITGSAGELTIIYCGTGLSIRTLHWALSSGEGVKEAQSEMFPYFEFPGWTGRDSIQSYIERVMDHLPDKESKNMIGSLLPPAATAMLHERLTGRFRPVVTA